MNALITEMKLSSGEASLVRWEGGETHDLIYPWDLPWDQRTTPKMIPSETGSRKYSSSVSTEENLGATKSTSLTSVLREEDMKASKSFSSSSGKRRGVIDLT